MVCIYYALVVKSSIFDKIGCFFEVIYILKLNFVNKIEVLNKQISIIVY